MTSWVVLFTPESGVPSAPPGTDKVVHLALFAALAITGRIAGARTAWLLPALAGYAALSEVLQGLLPIGRSCELLDVAVDVAGALLGWALLSLRPSGASPR
ncbi:VanZ family protein [Saccharopolyspora mangrovi]|uniref:VanZ family protein n=1 Tax=Saccharopolyspora mangrovi TaxID=3082379 RepID=A0ABU6ALL7_9PSEU|nr:VanZ family protein [Saccharopolyspora sp. S2-29]MEB3372454.1 VanZ family protein [Saccharopolyspora sp. S2-29]